MRIALWIAGCLLGFLVILDQKFGLGMLSLLTSLAGHLLLGGLHYAWVSLLVALPTWAGLGWWMLLIAFACAAWHCYFRLFSRRNVASLAGDLPLLVSPSPINHSKYVVICNDTSTSLATAEQYRDALQKWRIASEESGAALQRTAPEPGGPKP